MCRFLCECINAVNGRSPAKLTLHMRVHQVCLLAAVCLCQTPPSNQTSRPRLRRPRFSAPDIGNAIPHQEPSWYVLHTTELLISSWFCIFALILLVSMFGDEPSGCRASLGTLVL